MMVSKLLLCQIWVLVVTAYLIDQSNYFYLNSSFHKETVSFSLCFHFDQPTVVSIQSPLLVPMENHITVGEFNDQVKAKFSPPFDSNIVGYNNFDLGEYWLGVKFIQQNELRKGTFEKINIRVTMGEKVYKYVFMAPLFRMPLNAFQMYPTNTLYQYQDWMLISYLYKLKEVDAYIFQKSNTGKTYKLLQKGEWGFSNEDSNTIYQRHKSKKHQTVTLQITSGQSKHQLLISPQDRKEGIIMDDGKFEYTLQDLLQRANQVDQKQSEL